MRCPQRSAAPMPRIPPALAPKLTAALKPGDTVLVKGSLGSRMAVIVEALKGKAG